MTETRHYLSGYTFFEILYASAKTLVYRGQRQLDEHPVVIKLLQNDYPDFNELSQFRNQYNLLKNLDVAGIVRPLHLQQYQNGFALIMEDTGSIDFQKYLATHTLSLNDFFKLAIAMAKILHDLYLQHIIHKDIKPANILINPETKQIHLIDFGIASLLPKEIQVLKSPNILEGTLAYISPEQTGRMNRGIDYRSDFYSLGVTFYQWLTGHLPFESDDPMELVHSHLAKVPLSPSKHDANLPQTVSDIILKLMAKTVEERYQSALGLQQDLTHCQQQWQATGDIIPFALGQQDIAEHFQIPDKLYGRVAEVKTLLTAFDRVSEGQSEMMLVTGFSGVGKTALINEIHKPITRQHGFFIKGKFDQFNRDKPFSALIQAFQMLLEQLITESPTQVQNWKTKLLTELDNNGQVLIDFIPELELLIGPQPSVPVLEGEAAKIRFQYFLQKFIRTLSKKQHPVTIFLDDLQWIDAASLELLPALMAQGKDQALLLIGAYRNNEVDTSHALMLNLETLRKNQVQINQITLSPLAYTELNEWIADALCCPQEAASSLTEIVHRKTQGNPFFSHQFVHFLHEDGFIKFNLNTGVWQADIERIKQLAGHDNVVDLMVYQLERLPQHTQTALKLAACIGNQFDLATLVIINEISEQETTTHLWPALKEGLVLPLNDDYKFYQAHESTAIHSTQVPLIEYRFLHDRVQQAAYSLIAANQKSMLHLKVGHLLKSSIKKERLDEKLFDITRQLNLGSDLISNQNERDELAVLNLKAGSKAKSSTAYLAANNYFTSGITLLATDCWQRSYDLTLSLYESATEIAYLMGNYEQQAKWSAAIFDHVPVLLDKIPVYQLQYLSYVSQNLYLEAINTALPVLKQLGITFPDPPEPEDIQQGLQQTKITLADKSIQSLVSLPLMSNKKSLAAMQILSKLIPATYGFIPALFPLIVFKQIQLSLCDGNTADSINAYATYGSILCSDTDSVETGYQFGQLALALLDQMEAKDLEPNTYLVVSCAINPWKKAIREHLIFFQKGFKSGVETGNYLFASSCTVYYLMYSYFAGKTLTNLEQETISYREALNHLQQKAFINQAHIIHQVILTLTTHSELTDSSQSSFYEEPIILSKPQEYYMDWDLLIFYMHKMMLAFLFQENKTALAHVTATERYLDGAAGTFMIVLFHFYDSLIRLAVFLDSSASEQSKTLEKVKSNQEKMFNWAKNAPMNFQHKWALVEAEKLRVTGDILAAEDHYDNAIAGAKENQYAQEEALSYELAARFYLTRGKDMIAQTYMIQAYYAYTRWGAKTKVKDLERRYPVILARVLNPSTTGTPFSNTQTTVYATQSETIDLSAILKCARTLSGELSLSGLLGKILNIVMENAGAQRCVFLLNQEQQWQIAGVCGMNKDDRQILPSIALVDFNDLPATLIHHVIDKQQPITLDDARDPHQRFNADPYFRKYPELKSVLCLPILSQAKLVGLLYLENSLTINTFNAKRLQMLQMLSAQAAISIENAMFYQSLEEKVEQRTQELQQEIIERKQAENSAKAAEAAAKEAEKAAKEAEDIAKVAKQKAFDANEAKSTFLANMSHELRSPLNAVLGFAQIMQRSDNLPLDHLENVGIINRSGEYLLSLINDVLDMSKIEAGKITLDEQSFDFHQLLDDIHDLFDLRVQNKGLHFLIERLNLPQYIFTDGKKLRQVLINLLGNAVKFTQEGGISFRIVTEAEDQQKCMLTFSVKDSGAGIADHEVDQLFEAFGQTASGRAALEGTGLGLPISRKFVQLMGGDIAVNSELGRGTTFEFSIRVPVVSALDSCDVAFNQHKIIALEPGQPHYRILIVDDLLENRQLLIKLLNPFGFEIRDVSNGLEAVNLCKTWPPQFIWMDVRMPVMDGLEATAKIKALPDGNKIVIVALTASTLDEEKICILTAGCDDFLAKPFKEVDVFALMNKHIGVRYVYEMPPEPIEQELTLENLSQEMLINIPNELMEQMLEALLCADRAWMQDLTKQVRLNDAGIADSLSKLIKNYQYDLLQDVLEKAKHSDIE